jgi:hypothetical protein
MLVLFKENKGEFEREKRIELDDDLFLLIEKESPRGTIIKLETEFKNSFPLLIEEHIDSLAVYQVPDFLQLIVNGKEIITIPFTVDDGFTSQATRFKDGKIKEDFGVVSIEYDDKYVEYRTIDMVIDNIAIDTKGRETLSSFNGNINTHNTLNERDDLPEKMKEITKLEISDVIVKALSSF